MKLSPIREMIISANDRELWDGCMLLHRQILREGGHKQLGWLYDICNFQSLAEMKTELEYLLVAILEGYYEIDDGEEDGQRHNGRLPGVVGGEVIAMGWNDRLDYQESEEDADKWMCENCGGVFPSTLTEYKVIVGSHGARECLDCVKEFYEMNPDIDPDDEDGRPFS